MKDVRISVAEVGIRFELPERPETFATWNWKIDPYRRADVPTDITVRHDAQMDYTRGELLSDVSSGRFRRQVYSAADGGTIWQLCVELTGEVYLRCHLSAGRSVINIVSDRTYSCGSIAFEYLGQLVPGIFLDHGAMTFHGVLMEYDGKGIILSAPSGEGKSTHARFWRDEKHALILNGDRAVCREENGVWVGYGLPWSGSSGEQINRSVPISAIVVLERGDKNEAWRVPYQETFSEVWPHVLHPEWNGELTEKALLLLDRILAAVPVVKLRCLPEVESVEVLCEALEKL